MSRESLILLVGLVVFFTPFLGIPSTWKTIILVVSGVLLMLVGYSLRRSAFLRSLDTGSGERKSDAFVESMGGPRASEADKEHEQV